MEYGDNKYKNFLSKLSKLKNRKELRIKLTKLSNNYFKPRCNHFIDNMRNLNFRILESSGGKKSIEKEVKESRNFRFGKSKDYFIHLTDLSPFKIEINPFIASLKKQFTKEEINIIKKNKDYYIQNPYIKDSVALFNDQSLYQVLNIEEREEEIAKENMKVFHNLNFFNNKRKSILLNLSNANMSNNSLDKSDTKNKNNKSPPLYQTSLMNYKKKLKEDKNNVNLSHYLLKKNKLDIIERDIRKEVLKRRKEDEKNNLINLKTKNLVYDMSRESQNEINKILNDKNIKNYYNYNYYITKQLNYFNKKHHIFNENLTEISFPLINNLHSLSKTVSPIKCKKNIHSIINNSPSIKLINNNMEDKENLKKKIILYKKGKLKELKKKEENEQVILRDINRKIKSIYDRYKDK
jgi:hypothetical protein